MVFDLNQTLDPNLRQFATDIQWRAYEAFITEGSYGKAATKLNLTKGYVFRCIKAIKNRAAKAGYSPEHDMNRQVPDGYLVKGVSTLYKPDGSVVMQWVKSAIDHDRQEEMFRELVAAVSSEIPRAVPVKKPTGLYEDLLVGIPVGDLHVGMLAWHEENQGRNYDLDKCEELFTGAIDHLINSTPITETCLLGLMGDFMHYDSEKPMTPTHGNLLDADSRPAKMVRTAIRLAKYAIESLRRRHGKVHVIVEIGNHDLYSSLFLAECLAALYEKEPRVIIDTSPRHYHYFRFGKCLIGTHHGHGRKLPDLPLIMAMDRASDWGETRHRYWWTGHVHHDQVKDIQGVKVESFRVLPPTDAWADRAGYRPLCDMKAIVYHKEYGEVSRSIVNPEMFL